MAQFVLSLLRNRSTAAWHPVLFKSAPLPPIARSGPLIVRFRVNGYCVQGFPDRDEALKFATTRWVPELQNVDTAFESDLDWGGRDDPEFTCLYSKARGVLVNFE